MSILLKTIETSFSKMLKYISVMLQIMKTLKPFKWEKNKWKDILSQSMSLEL